MKTTARPLCEMRVLAAVKSGGWMFGMAICVDE